MTRQQSTTSIQLPSSSVVTSAATMSDEAQTHLQTQRAPSKQEIQVADKVRLHLAKQIGAAIKTEHAAHLIAVLDQRAIGRWAEFVDYDRAIREQVRNSIDQADIEAFNQAIRQGHADSLLSLRQRAATVIEGIAGESLDPDDDPKPSYTVVEKPPLWGLFGGQEITRVVYG
jgi:hypothetical protein